MTESQESANKSNLPEQESEQSVLNRRQFIGFGASAATAALAFPKAAQAYVQFPGMPGKGKGRKTRRVTQNSKIIIPSVPTIPPLRSRGLPRSSRRSDDHAGKAPDSW